MHLGRLRWPPVSGERDRAQADGSRALHHHCVAETDRGAQIRIPGVFRFIIKYVSPLYLIVIFLGFCIYELPPYIKNLFGESLAAS